MRVGLCNVWMVVWMSGLLLLYKVAIIDFLEELAYVRRRRN